MLNDCDLTDRYRAELAALAEFCRQPPVLACIGGAQRALCGDLTNGLRIELGNDLLTNHGPAEQFTVFLFDDEGQLAYLDATAGALTDRLTAAAAALTAADIVALRAGRRPSGLHPSITVTRPAPPLHASLNNLAAALTAFHRAADRGPDAEAAAARELAAATQDLLDLHGPATTGPRG
ncbi:hypothetical protein ACFWPH_28345 [Nocardia sp. NPDC058499]|uniref:hypothetical protein n=1 Tax=Nocardia sp. NPDC058499 TaxID=3346530 RepID=UPI00364CE572